MTHAVYGIREQLKQASIRDRDLDREVMVDWAAVDDESWQHLEEKPKRKPGRAGAKSVKSAKRLR